VFYALREPIPENDAQLEMIKFHSVYLYGSSSVEQKIVYVQILNVQPAWKTR